MPYAPGIQDISGQLTAQGINQAAQAYAQKVGSISNAVTGFMQTYQQNQMMTSQAMGKFQGALRSDPALQKYIQDAASDDPNTPKLSPELQKAIDNAKAGKIDLYDAAVLGNFVDTWGSNRQRQAQAALRQAQADRLMQETQAAQADRARQEQALLTMQNLSRGQGAGVYRSDVQQQMANNPFVRAQMQALQAGAPMSGGQLGQFVMNQQELAAKQGGSNELNITQALPEQNPQTGETRLVSRYKSGPLAGQIHSSAPSPDDPGLKGRAKEQELLVEGAVKSNAAIEDSGNKAQNQIFATREAKKLINQGVQSGWLEDKLLDWKSAAVSAGLADPKSVTSAQTLRGLLYQNVLEQGRELAKGTGTISNFERESISKATASFDKNPEANLALLNMIEAAHSKSIAANKKRAELEDAGLNAVQIRQAMTRWVNSPENALANFMPVEKVERVRMTGNLPGSMVFEPVTQPTAARSAAPISAPATLPPGWSLKP